MVPYIPTFPTLSMPQSFYCPLLNLNIFQEENLNHICVVLCNTVKQTTCNVMNEPLLCAVLRVTWIQMLCRNIPSICRASGIVILSFVKWETCFILCLGQSWDYSVHSGLGLSGNVLWLLHASHYWPDRNTWMYITHTSFFSAWSRLSPLSEANTRGTHGVSACVCVNLWLSCTCCVSYSRSLLISCEVSQPGKTTVRIEHLFTTWAPLSN